MQSPLLDSNKMWGGDIGNLVVNWITLLKFSKLLVLYILIYGLTYCHARGSYSPPCIKAMVQLHTRHGPTS